MKKKFKFKVVPEFKKRIPIGPEEQEFKDKKRYSRKKKHKKIIDYRDQDDE